MRRRSRRPDLRLLRALGPLVLVTAASVGARADGVVGVIDMHARVSFQGRHGAGVSADALWGGERLRAGLTLGVDAVRAASGETSAVITPMGLSGLWRIHGAARSPFVGVRAGVAVGAQQGGFFAGPFGALSAGYAFPFGEAAAFRLGAECWGSWSSTRTELWLGPSVGIAF